MWGFPTSSHLPWKDHHHAGSRGREGGSFPLLLLPPPPTLQFPDRKEAGCENWENRGRDLEGRMCNSPARPAYGRGKEERKNPSAGKKDLPKLFCFILIRPLEKIKEVVKSYASRKQASVSLTPSCLSFPFQRDPVIKAAAVGEEKKREEELFSPLPPTTSFFLSFC